MIIDARTKLTPSIILQKKIIGIGSVLIFLDTIKTDFKIGLWTEYFENGKIKSIGTYAIDYITVCCYAYPCATPIVYKKGAWKYYYENGSLKATGTYKLKRKRMGYSHEKD